MLGERFDTGGRVSAYIAELSATRFSAMIETSLPPTQKVSCLGCLGETSSQPVWLSTSCLLHEHGCISRSISLVERYAYTSLAMNLLKLVYLFLLVYTVSRVCMFALMSGIRLNERVYFMRLCSLLENMHQ